MSRNEEVEGLRNGLSREVEKRIASGGGTEKKYEVTDKPGGGIEV